jgi:putative RNA 2'-phosphotransferase
VSGAEVVRHSKRLSWLLRHGAGAEGIPMDAAGWVEVAAVLDALGLTRAELEEAVATNDKGRFQLDGGRVRAGQGHSRAGMPVTAEALEASWQPVEPAGSLWHATSVAAVAGIARTGIEPGRRTHVHLAASPDSPVGKRTAAPLLLEVSPTGLAVFAAPNGVLLVRHVPRASIVGVRGATRAGRAAASGAATTLGL